MLNQYSRAERIYGADGMQLLRSSRVAVFGVGGVGGYVVEALARMGVGTLDLVDSDRVDLTNLNRQILATHSTIGQYKVDAARARIREIDPDINVHTYKTFFLPETAGQFDFRSYDYVADAIDTVSGKIQIILQAQAAEVPVISAMGCGNRTDPTQLTVTDLFRTSQDPLARVMRRELRKRGVQHLKVVCSTEPAVRPMDSDTPCLQHGSGTPDPDGTGAKRRAIPGSTSFVPSAAGMMMAAAIVNDLTRFDPAGRTKGGLRSYEGKQES